MSTLVKKRDRESHLDVADRVSRQERVSQDELNGGADEQLLDCSDEALRCEVGQEQGRRKEQDVHLKAEGRVSLGSKSWRSHMTT